MQLDESMWTDDRDAAKAAISDFIFNLEDQTL